LDRAFQRIEQEYDLLLYDVTSTFFEGGADFPLAQRGHSRDQRSDCKQVCIRLVVSRCGMPLEYEVFAGNTADVTTVKGIVEMIERRYGKSDRIWVIDRGMVSEDNIRSLFVTRSIHFSANWGSRGNAPSGDSMKNGVFRWRYTYLGITSRQIFRDESGLTNLLSRIIRRVGQATTPAHQIN
jgi:hypothetical protein